MEHVVAFLLCPQMLTSSVSLPMEQLRAAETLARLQRKHRETRLSFKMVSIDGQPVTTHTGIKLAPDCAIEDLNEAHITYLPALWRSPKPVLKTHKALYPWLYKQTQLGHRLAGVGTGCCLLAEAGLLNGKPATTHWYYFDEFEKNYPNVVLKRQNFITQSDKIFCTGSITSLADLTVFFIEELFNLKIAREVERHFFHEVRQAYHLKHQSREDAFGHPDEHIAEAQAWINHNAEQDIQISTLALQFKMSLRSFNRRFKNATNLTPLQYLQKVRMRLAGELLQTTNLSIAEVAYSTGYSDVAHFTSLFKKHFSTTPGAYRTTVRAKLFHAN